MIDIDIVCPIYKESASLENLVKSFATQKGVNIKKIIFPVTLSHTEEDDVIRDIVKRYNIISFELENIPKKDILFYKGIQFIYVKDGQKRFYELARKYSTDLTLNCR